MKYDYFEALHEDLCSDACKLTRRKGADYSGQEDTLRNLKAVELVGLCPAETGVLVRMQDKMSRLTTLVGAGATPQVADESVRDTILDLINYSVLLWALIQEEASDRPH
ncbi:MAG TPA: hypothetical protein VM537_31500 [Anaerolineae bacterium]|nr:hypothetical protein [Anaerolineae bacterium]